tara:strand:+ start:348 stop:458 length:111 start_codon:yes stop_codon:yes gene_type:complete
MTTNEHHKWLKKREWAAVLRTVQHDDLIERKYKERD